MTSAASTSQKYKLVLPDGEFRIFSSPSNTRLNYENWRDRVRDIYERHMEKEVSRSLKMYFLDEESDWCVLDKNAWEDLADAPRLRIKVKEREANEDSADDVQTSFMNLTEEEGLFLSVEDKNVIQDTCASLKSQRKNPRELAEVVVQILGRTDEKPQIEQWISKNVKWQPEPPQQPQYQQPQQQQQQQGGYYQQQPYQQPFPQQPQGGYYQQQQSQQQQPQQQQQQPQQQQQYPYQQPTGYPSQQQQQQPQYPTQQQQYSYPSQQQQREAQSSSYPSQQQQQQPSYPSHQQQQHDMRNLSSSSMGFSPPPQQQPQQAPTPQQYGSGYPGSSPNQTPQQQQQPQQAPGGKSLPPSEEKIHEMIQRLEAMGFSNNVRTALQDNNYDLSATVQALLRNE